MEHDTSSRDRRLSSADCHRVDSARSPRHSPVRYNAPSRGVGDHDVLYPGESRRRYDHGDATPGSNHDVTGMSLCTIDAADVSYLEFPTPAGSGNCNYSVRDPARCLGDPNREHPDAVSATGGRVRQPGGDPPTRHNPIHNRVDLQLREGTTDPSRWSE